MRRRSWVSGLLILSLMLGLFGFAPSKPIAAAAPSAPSAGQSNEPVDLGAPVQTAQAIDVEFGIEEGVNVAYTTVTGSASAGDYATFSVLDLDNEVRLRTYKLEGASNAWSHTKTPDGRVFIGGSNKMFVYSPVTKQVTDLGVPIAGSSSIWSLTSDEQGNVYGGIYSESVKGRILRIDAQTLEITDLLNGPVDAQEAYIRSIVYHDGYLYAGTGSSNGRVWKISTTEPQQDQTRLELPGTPSDDIYAGKYNAMGFVYALNIHEHYLFAFYNGPSIMQVYDLDTGRWIDASFSNIRGVEAATGYKDGKVYTSKKDKMMWEIDLAAMTEKPVMPFDGNIRHSEWLQLPNQPDFPRGAMASISFNAKVTLSDPGLQLQRSMKLLVDGQGINLQALETGPDGKLYMSTYLNSEGAQYDPATGKFTIFPLGQAEGIGHVGDKVYFGLYPKADIAVYDTTAPLSTTKEPASLFHIGEEQDRPFIVTEGDGKLLLGTIPGYSQTGGALTIYDPAATEASGQPQFEVFRHIVQDQSITGLLYHNGLIFGSTSISGGLGEAPAGARAKLFVWDMAAKKKLYEWEPTIEGISSLQMISGLTLGPDGLIWAAANGVVFAFNPETREVVKSRNIHPDVTLYGKWRPVHQRFSSDGLLYSDAAGKLVVIDPETMGCTLIRDKASLFTLDRNDNLYVADATRLLRYAPFAKPEAPGGEPEGPSKRYLDIKNDGFEDVNEDGSIPGWTITSFLEGYASVSVTDEKSAAGGKSVKLVDSSDKSAVELKSDPVRVKPGRQYTVSFNMYLDGSFPNPDSDKPFSMSRASVGVRYYDADGKELKVTASENNHVAGPQKSWIPVEMNVMVPANAVEMRLIVFCSPLWVATVYYDEVSAYTIIDPSEVPVVSAEAATTDIKEGADATLSVKATEQADIIVMEGDKVVAQGIGAGDTPVTLTIPAPGAGAHNYTVTADVPLVASSEPAALPTIHVHRLSKLELSEDSIHMQVGDVYQVKAIAVYGPVTEDVSSEAILQVKPAKTVNVEGSTVTALKQGNAKVTVAYGGKTEELRVKVTQKGHK
ncbi:carbohydrate binding domain-containing protein [Paenibacillus spongiae]|uniref:CBM-cenC domain-containing protein n=1 Tax=Paenibacillus spongiae TaxID=2909671 RepID=A0ABY5SAG7_9BACL|nr:carbohydrate binding domain-containing protein [Paenibacillus spongiae]UVI30644.1 hypothetical protein L1F29_01830 [Paenibacillus spongiae]